MARVAVFRTYWHYVRRPPESYKPPDQQPQRNQEMVKHLALLFLLFATPVTAGTITTFVASGEFGGPGSANPAVTNIDFRGTITIDTTIGQVTESDIFLICH